MSTYRDLQKKCLQLKLKPCNGKFDVLKALVDAAIRAKENKVIISTKSSDGPVISQILIGVQDIDQEILLNLNGELLFNTCQLDKYSANLCDEYFWARKNKREFGGNTQRGNRELYRKLYPMSVNEQLVYVSRIGYLEIVKYLISQGADIHADNDYAVRMASENGHLDVVEYLVSQGADIRAWDDAALRLASENGHLELVKYLVSQDIHANKDYALKLASSNGHLEVVKYLVSQGADIHADDDSAARMAYQNGYTFQWDFRFGRHLEVVKYLVSQGANV